MPALRKPPLRFFELPEFWPDDFSKDPCERRKKRTHAGRWTIMNRFPGRYRYLPPTEAWCDQPLDPYQFRPERERPNINGVHISMSPQPDPDMQEVLREGFQPDADSDAGAGFLPAGPGGAPTVPTMARHADWVPAEQFVAGTQWAPANSTRAQIGQLQAPESLDEMCRIVQETVSERLKRENGVPIEPEEIIVPREVLQVEIRREAHQDGMQPGDAAILAMGNVAGQVWLQYKLLTSGKERKSRQLLRSFIPGLDPVVTPDCMFYPPQQVRRQCSREQQMVWAPPVPVTNL